MELNKHQNELLLELIDIDNGTNFHEDHEEKIKGFIFTDPEDHNEPGFNTKISLTKNYP